MLTAIITALPLAADAAKEESSNFLVSPDIGLMIWTLLAFLVAFLVLRKLAFPRISEALDRRQRVIEESIDSAERTKTEAEQLLAEYRERLKGARAQGGGVGKRLRGARSRAEEIVMRARRAGEQHERESLEGARESREELLEQTRRD